VGADVLASEFGAYVYPPDVSGAYVYPPDESYVGA
jgi:hypothetical protein